MAATAVGCARKIDLENATRMELESRRAALVTKLHDGRTLKPAYTIQDAADAVLQSFGGAFFKSEVVTGAAIRFNPVSEAWTGARDYSSSVAVYLDRQILLGVPKTNGYPAALFSGEFSSSRYRPF